MNKLIKIYKQYRYIVDKVDKYFSIGLYHIIYICHYLAQWGSGWLENYIIKHNYSNLTQYERAFGDDVICTMSLMLSSSGRRTWTEVQNFFFDKSKGVVLLSKRQCYKIIALIPKKAR